MQRVKGARPDLGKTDHWSRFRGLTWWQWVLSVLPFGLFVGGALGAGIGLLGIAANTSIARKQFPAPLKALAMTGVVLAAYLVWLAIAVILNTTVN
ncbi:hypothetical protein ACIP98_35235 [Streptomyces sp. NPDC088354]|uniref:hypothetical protein n=1 Tax=unclassified Streptomyces TaxID=2593676 RepID=UPI0029A124B4|nr:hypothetical protein [Streptomyces sp. MI02-7b]MDX3075630.1 hypothetical protein [Streptomyces sp. MI02-7b]